MSGSREIQAGVPQGSVLYRTLYSLYTNYAPQTPSSYLALFADILYRSQRWLCSQRGSMQSHFSQDMVRTLQQESMKITLRPSISHTDVDHLMHLTLNGQNIPFVNHI